MTSKNIEIQESCDSSIESTVPEHLDAGINNGDDSFETFGSIPILIPILSELHHIFLTSER